MDNAKYAELKEKIDQKYKEELEDLQYEFVSSLPDLFHVGSEIESTTTGNKIHIEVVLVGIDLRTEIPYPIYYGSDSDGNKHKFGHGTCRLTNDESDKAQQKGFNHAKTTQEKARD